MSEEKKNEVLGQSSALEEPELADVAGGKECVCVLGGGGEASEEGEKTCACVGVGFGMKDDENIATGKTERCVCIAGGAGA